MDDFTVGYLQLALFGSGEFELTASEKYSDIGLDWNDPATLDQHRVYEPHGGWLWDGTENAEGITWGGCLESIDEILRHGVAMPSLDDFNDIVLITETSEEIPSADYVHRVYRALGERGVLGRIKGVLVGRPKAWEFNNLQSTEQKKSYKKAQAAITLETVRRYNSTIPVVQNLDFGHTEPQICLPYGRSTRLNSTTKKIYTSF